MTTKDRSNQTGSITSTVELLSIPEKRHMMAKDPEILGRRIPILGPIEGKQALVVGGWWEMDNLFGDTRWVRDWTIIQPEPSVL